MASPPTSECGFYDPASQAWLDAPREWEPAWLVVRRPVSEWEQLDLRVNGLPLDLAVRRIEGAPRLVAEWPRSGTGHFQVELHCGGTSSASLVTVESAKLSAGDFVALLDDLQRRLPAAVAQALQRCGALAGIRVRPAEETTAVAELNRLRRAVSGSTDRPGLVAVLTQLAGDHHQVLLDTAPWMRSFRARRPRPERLFLALRGADLDDNRKPARVIDTAYEPSADVYENQLVRAYADEVAARLRRLEPLASTAAAARELGSGLAVARRRAAFLDAVRPLDHAPGHTSMVLLRRPPYPAALSGYLELHQTAEVQVVEPGLDAPLENLPRLYELWGTLQVCLAVLQAAGTLGYHVVRQRLVRRARGTWLVEILPDGEPALVLEHGDGTVARLVPQPTYGATGEIRSVSYPQRPDIVLDVRRPGWRPELWLFDPKYKLQPLSMDAPPDEDAVGGRPSKVDIDKMHAYRDAIRHHDDERVVAYAAILYPGPTARYDTGLAALSATPLHGDELGRGLGVVAATALRAVP